jgi:type I restriction enzyme S subunit
MPQQPRRWEAVPFDKTLWSGKVKVGKLNRSEYEHSGVLPVIDQGQAEIAGYTSRTDLAYNGPLPVVVFGDHTRTLKFVDRQFVAGADGTKILVPDTTRFDPLYYYYALRSLDIPSRGYNRHYSLLREQRVPAPPVEEQRRIASVLSTIGRAEEACAAELAAAKALMDAARERVFDVEGVSYAPLSDLVDPERPICYGIVQPGPAIPDGVPYINVVDIADGEILDDQLKRTSQAIDEQYGRSRVQPDDVILAVRGAHDRAALVPSSLAGANLSRGCARIALRGSLPSGYVYHWLQGRRAQAFLADHFRGVRSLSSPVRRFVSGFRPYGGTAGRRSK